MITTENCIDKCLATYNNGNYNVCIYEDGTKIRTFIKDPLPEHPESIDIKITNWCDAACDYCHENSVPSGKHASIEIIERMVKDLPPGVELAIGGGDPLSHPQIRNILKLFKDKGFISNITVNNQHTSRHRDSILSLREAKLVYGVGISYNKYYFIEEELLDDNTIVHFIVGKDRAQDALSTLSKHKKILILGYKEYGRGIKYMNPGVYSNIREWRYWIYSILRRGIICFDNLALEQLNVRKFLPSDVWEKCYMGDDGKFTMYADAVKDMYAKSSTSLKEAGNGRTIKEYFSTISS